MANPVTIAGSVVDADDPCALWQALYAVKLKRLAGEEVAEGEIRSAVSTRRFQFANASIAALDKELDALRAQCEAKRNGRPARHAISFGYR